MPDSKAPGDEPEIRPEAVQAVYGALMDMDPDRLKQATETGITAPEYMRAISLFGESADVALHHRERELEAIKLIIGDEKLAEGTSWPELFDSLSPERAGQLRDLYDAMPDGARAEYDRRFGRPGEI